MPAISSRQSDNFERHQLRLQALWLTLAFWVLHLAVTCGRVGAMPNVELVAAFPRIAAFTAVSLLLSPLLYLILESLRHRPFNTLAPAVFAIAAVGGTLNAATMMLGYALVTGGVHPDGDPARFPAVAAYWMWIYLAWALAIIALLSRHDFRAGEPRAADEPGLDRGIWVNHRNGRVRVALSSVSWVEAAGDYVVLHSREGDFMTHASLNSLERRLDPREFIRIHRSAIVRLSAVTSVRSNASADLVLQLSDDVSVRVGRTYKPSVRSALGMGRRNKSH